MELLDMVALKTNSLYVLMKWSYKMKYNWGGGGEEKGKITQIKDPDS